MLKDELGDPVVALEKNASFQKKKTQLPLPLKEFTHLYSWNNQL